MRGGDEAMLMRGKVQSDIRIESRLTMSLLSKEDSKKKHERHSCFFSSTKEKSTLSVDVTVNV